MPARTATDSRAGGVAGAEAAPIDVCVDGRPVLRLVPLDGRVRVGLTVPGLDRVVDISVQPIAAWRSLEDAGRRARVPAGAVEADARRAVVEAATRSGGWIARRAGRSADGVRRRGVPAARRGPRRGRSPGARGAEVGGADARCGHGRRRRSDRLRRTVDASRAPGAGRDAATTTGCPRGRSRSDRPGAHRLRRAGARPPGAAVARRAGRSPVGRLARAVRVASCPTSGRPVGCGSGGAHPARGGDARRWAAAAVRHARLRAAARGPRPSGPAAEPAGRAARRASGPDPQRRRSGDHTPTREPPAAADVACTERPRQQLPTRRPLRNGCSDDVLRRTRCSRRTRPGSPASRRGRGWSHPGRSLRWTACRSAP